MLHGVDLSKAYSGRLVLSAVNVELHPGRALAVIGENGSGKSTLLSLLALAMPADRGRVNVDGLPLKAARAYIGYMPQDIALFEDLTVQENLRCFCRESGSEATQRLQKLCADLHIDDLQRKQIQKLSGGQRRRVSLAAALMNRPRYLLLDEPFAGVDSDGEKCIIELLRAIMAEGCGVAAAAHHAETLSPLMESVLCLEQGRVIFSGSLADYKQDGR